MRRDKVGRRDILRGRRGLSRAGGTLRPRGGLSQRERESNDNGECAANKSHGFRKTGSITVETKKNPAMLKSAGCIERPSAFTPNSPNATSVMARSIMPNPQPAITFAGCIIRTSAKARACTITTVIALAHTERDTSCPGTASVMIHAPRHTTAIVTAMNPANRFTAGSLPLVLFVHALVFGHEDAKH